MKSIGLGRKKGQVEEREEAEKQSFPCRLLRSGGGKQVCREEKCFSFYSVCEGERHAQ